MSNNVEVRTQRALFIAGKQITDWDEYEIRERIKEIVLYNENGFKIYDKQTGECLYVWTNIYNSIIGSYELLTNHVVICNDVNNNNKNYQVISYRGNILLPFDFGAKMVHTYSRNRLSTNIFYVCNKDGKEGYYFSRTNQFIEGSSIEKDSSRFYGAYRIKCDGKIKVYILKNGKYVCTKVM